jgi:hypothetical protein
VVPPSDTDGGLSDAEPALAGAALVGTAAVFPLVRPLGADTTVIAEAALMAAPDQRFPMLDGDDDIVAGDASPGAFTRDLRQVPAVLAVPGATTEVRPDTDAGATEAQLKHRDLPGRPLCLAPDPAGPRSVEVPIASPGYSQLPARGTGVQVDAELWITGQAPPGTQIDLFGHPYQVGPGGRFQLVLRVDDADLLRRALALHLPPELTRRRDE